MRKLICCILSVVMILSVCSIAFADDSVPDSSSGTELSENNIELPSSLLPVVLDDDTVRESDLMLRQFSVNLAQALATPTGNETAADIYALLYSAFINNPGGTSSFSVTDSSAIAWLQNIAYFLGYNNNSSQGSPLYYTLLSGNELSISELMYVLVSQMLNLMDLSATDSSNNPIPLVQLFVQLANDITGLSTNNTSQLTTLVSIASSLTDNYGSSIANRVYDIWAYMRDTIHGYDFYYTISALNDIKTSSQTLVSNTNTIINSLSSNGAIASGITSIQNDFNNISWVDSSSSFLGISLTLGGEITPSPSSDFTLINSRDSVYYLNYSSPGTLDGNKIYRFFVPIRVGATVQNGLILSVDDIYLNYSTLQSNVHYSIEIVPNYGYYIYIQNLSWRNYPITLKITCSSNQIRLYDMPLFNKVQYLSLDTLDGLFVSYYFNLLNMNDIMEVFKDIYASDDLIKAKEAQQDYEDQVLEDFTGSGSAAGKGSDISGAKDISTTLSSGLNSGGSVNNGLSVFNVSGGFWGWFSQENSDLINTLSSQTRSRSSGSGWVDDDPYQRNAEELLNILGGN